jgi:hypothetical protein
LSEKNTTENKVTESNIETIPSPTQLDRDEMQFQKLLQFANLARLIKRDLNSNTQVQYTFHKNFNKDEVMKWLANPEKFEKQLRNLSRFLYDTSSHYKRLIQYFATMLTFDYIVEPYGMTDFEPTPELIEKVRKKYIQTVNYLEVMNLKHEFLKVCERAWIDDVSYYYEFRLPDSYFLMPLNPDYCQVTGIEDGCLTFSYDFSYFKTYKNELDKFPNEFKEKYDLYKGDTKNYRWQEISPSKSLCIKIAESIDYPIPPFAGISEEIWGLEDYKSLKLAKTELENYLILVAKIPYLKNADTENRFGLSLDIAGEYFDKMLNNLPDQVGGLLSPFDDITAVKVDKNDKDTDKVSEAQKSIYDSAGVSQLLFNSSTTASTVTKGILVDENVAFKVLRQFERWINKKLKDENKGIKFKVQFLDLTKYSQDDYIKNLKDGATLGIPNKLKYAAALGQSPSSLLHMEFLENSVLGVTDNWKPLSSSYTQSGEGGRPQNDDDDLTDAGEITRDKDSNNPDVRD